MKRPWAWLAGSFCLVLAGALVIGTLGGTDSGGSARAAVTSELTIAPSVEVPVGMGSHPPPPEPELVREGLSLPSSIEPELSMEAPAERIFLVQSTEGRALEGALVQIYRAPWGSALAEARTDRDGRCELAALPGDELRVEASEHPLERFTLPAGPWPEPYIVMLTKGSRPLTGTVEDDAGVSVPGARIELVVEGRTVHATSGADGGFLMFLAGEAREGLLLASHPDHFFPGDQVLPLPSDVESRRLRLVLLRWARVGVQVIDPEGTHIAGARLRLLGPPDDAERDLLPLGLLGTFLTTASPELELQVPPGLPFWLAITHPDFEPREVEIGELEPGGRVEREVRLVRKSVSSRRFYQVLDPEGAPLVDAQVRHIGEGFVSLLRLDELAVFQVIPRDGDWKLVVTARGHGMREIAQGGGGATREDPERILLEPRPPTIVAIVGDGEGGRLGGVLVSVESTDSHVSSTVRSDEEGRAAFDVLLDGREYVVGVGAGRPGAYLLPGGLELVPDPPAHRVSRASFEPLRFELVPPGSIEGALDLADPSGKSVNLSCTGSRAAPRERDLFTLGAPLDPSGRFHFTGLPPGRYRIWIHDPEAAERGFEHPWAELDLDAGQALRLGSLQPPR